MTYVCWGAIRWLAEGLVHVLRPPKNIFENNFSRVCSFPTVHWTVSHRHPLACRYPYSTWLQF